MDLLCHQQRHTASVLWPEDVDRRLNCAAAAAGERMVIWHEQISAILARMTGCDRAAGDVARRALADPGRLPGVETWFKAAATERGYAEHVVDEVWDTVKEFGAYGFCRAHAVAFAVPAVQSAWLKTHHPAALYAGLLEHDPGTVTLADWVG